MSLTDRIKIASWAIILGLCSAGLVLAQGGGGFSRDALSLVGTPLDTTHPTANQILKFTGGKWTPAAAAAPVTTPSLQQVYAVGSSTDGTAGPVNFNNAQANGNNVINVSKSPAGAQSGNGVDITMGTNSGNGGSAGLWIHDSESAANSYHSLVVQKTNQTAGSDVFTGYFSGPPSTYYGGRANIVCVDSTPTATGVGGGIGFIGLQSGGGNMLGIIHASKEAGNDSSDMLFKVTTSLFASCTTILTLTPAGADITGALTAGTTTITGNLNSTNLTGKAGIGLFVTAANGQSLTLSGGSGSNVILKVGGSSVLTGTSTAMTTASNILSVSPVGSTTLGTSGNFGYSRLYLDYGNTSTVGNVTLNNASGRAIIGAGTSSFTVTDSVVSSDSHVIVSFSSDPGAACSIWATAGAGSFTVNTRPAVTNQSNIDFVVISANN